MSKQEQVGEEPSEGEEQEAPTQTLMCKYCGAGPFPTMSKLGIHSRKCEARKEAEKKVREAPPETIYKGELDVNAILNDILTKHPDISNKVKEEVMDWADRKGGLQPSEVAWILQSMRGITSTTANIIASKYSFALYKAQLEGKLQLPPVFGAPLPVQPPTQLGYPQVTPFHYQIQQQPQPIGIPAPQPASQQPSSYPAYSPQPYGYVPPYQPLPQYQPTPSQQDIRSIIREELRAPREPKETEAYVDIEEPVRNAEGQVIIGPDDRPIVKRMRVPASQASQFAAPKEDVEMRLLEKLGKYRDLFGPKEELTVEKIREIIRQETPTPPAKEEKPPITIEEVQKVSSEAAQSVAKALIETQEKERKEDERFKRLEDTIRSTASAKAVEGYREDSFRILGQGLQEAAGVVRERKPVEVIIREGGPLVFGGAPSKEVEAGAGKGLIDRFKERGWVTEQ